MASNQTSNYQLHLWEPGDDFLREEFNENTEAIDEALGKHNEAITAAATRVKLFEITVGQKCTEIEVDVSSIDWSQWDHVEIRAHLLTDLTSGIAGQSYLRINEDSGVNYLSGIHRQGQLGILYDHNNPGYCAAHCVICLRYQDDYCMSWHQSEAYGLDGNEFEGATQSGTCGYHFGSVPFSTLNWSCAQSYLKYQPGGKLVFWGVK